jgi:preprotein translocase subunit SecG
MMHVTQSFLERAMYLLLVLLFITNFIVAFVLYHEYRDTKTVISNQSANVRIIKYDQKTNALAIKTYIACLINISPTIPPAQITHQEQICFDNAPQVK